MVRDASSPSSSPKARGGASSGGATPNKLRRKIPEATAAEAPAARLVEYFVVVSSKPRWNAAGGGSPGKKGMKTFNKKNNSLRSVNQGGDANGNIHLPQTANNDEQDYTFSPKITARYPLVDNPDNPLNPMITQFCYPHSDSIVPSNTYVMPRIHHFVLTNDKGCKVYGTCLTLYEKYIPRDTKDPYSRRHSIHASTTHTTTSSAWNMDEEENIEVTVMDEDDMTKEESALYIPRVLCILSTWPYLLAFREYLTQLYRLTLSTTMEAPLERYIQNLCMEIPAPPPGAFEIELTILDSSIRFWAPPAKLPVSFVALPYQTLFECLDLHNILHVWYALLMEQKVLLVSSQYSILTVCAEILQSLLFPLKWSHLYIPMLPRFLSPMLDAPIPYLVGVIRENWVYAESSVSAETMVVDLDSNECTFGPAFPPLPNPPMKRWEKLTTALEETVGELYYKTRGLEEPYHLMMRGKLTQEQLEQLLKDMGNAGWKEKLRGFDDAFNMAYMPDSPNLTSAQGEDEDGDEQSQWERVQEAFLRFFVTTFKSYQKFLHVPDDNNADADAADAGNGKRWNHARRSFDRDGYVSWQSQEDQAFYQEVCQTQQFDDFITKRLYSPGEPDVIFFDQSIDSKKNRSKLRMKKVETPFLLNAKAHKVLQKVRAVEPSNEGLVPGKVYSYNTWPDKFDTSLFGAPRPIPSIITAEFDRQAALVARLRKHHDAGENDDAFLLGGDFDTSPEVAVFTVFFFTYGAIVGRDWQLYQDKMREESAMNITIDEGDLHEHLVPLSDVEVAPLQIKSSEEGDISDPVTVATAGETVTSKSNKGAIVTAEEALRGDDCGLCDDLLPSGMILSVPDCQLPRCNPIFQNKQFSAMWTHDSPHTQGAQQGTSLLDMDDDHLAEYEEAKEIAAAQLELAFDALSAMSARGLPTDPDAFKSLMEACGRCGNTDRALQLIHIMKRDGFVADSEIYSCFLYAFAQEETSEGHQFAAMNSQPSSPGGTSDAYSAYLQKRMQQSKAADKASNPYKGNSNDDEESSTDLQSDGSFSDGSLQLDSNLMRDIYNAVFVIPQQKVPKRRNKKKRKKPLPKKNSRLPVNGRLLLQVVLGDSLLSYVYPKHAIDTDSNSCPQCSTVLDEENIVSGWTPCEFQDFNTECPQCKHRFVPHFTVRCSSPEFVGTQGRGTPLYCEFLSPWVLRKELEFVIHGVDGVEGMVDPDWRKGTDIRATLWWNLIVAFNRYRLPVSFLFEGSFQNRLITPTPGI